jgi:stage II sporulation SpoE-like protein
MTFKQEFAWRDVAWYGVASIIGGAVFELFISGFRWEVRGLLHGGLIGFTCYCGALSLGILFNPWVKAAPSQWWRRALLFFVGGQIGWVVGLTLGIALIWGEPIASVRIPRSAAIIAIVCGGIGTVFGLAAYAYEALKTRLRDSMEQLKDKEVAEKELGLAREFQTRLLPAADIEADGYRIVSRNLPARYVAGDFYDVFQYPDGAVGIAIADVAGKGVAASLIMASVKAVLPLLAASRDVNDAMGALNSKLEGELGKREFVALALARFEPRTGAVTFANAGMPDAYIVRQDGRLEIISVTGARLPLGLREAIDYDKSSFTLGEGDSLFLLSDGLPEATTTDGEQLGYDRLANIIRETREVDEILKRIQAMTTPAREDDQTIVMLERRKV